MIKITEVFYGDFVDKPATYTHFVESRFIEEFVIIKEYKKDIYNVSVLLHNGNSISIGGFSTYDDAESIINTIYFRMNLERIVIVDVDKLKEELANGKN